MQELNKFVHYYTRYKNHENSYKLEEPLIKTAKEKMLKLAEAVTDLGKSVQSIDPKNAILTLNNGKRI